MGHLLKIKCLVSRVNVRILASTSAPFTLTTVQVPKLALTHTDKKEIQISSHKEIQKGSIAKSYMTDGLLKYG